MLFEEQSISAVQTLPIAESHFTHLLSSPNSKELRKFLSVISEVIPIELVLQYKESLHSLNNRTSFQAFCELTSLIQLHQLGWKYDPLEQPDGGFKLNKDDQYLILIPISIIQQPSLTIELENRAKLQRVLNRIQSKHKVGIVLRRPLPEMFDPDPIRLSISKWLESDNKPGTFAYYKDQNVWIEVGLLNTTPNEEGDFVSFIQGAIRGDTIWDHVKENAQNAINRYQRSNPDSKCPIVLSIGANRPLPILPNLLRYYLYGPLHSFISENNRRVCSFDPTLNLAWLHEEENRNIGGIIINTLNTNTIEHTSYQNPWHTPSNNHLELPKPAFIMTKMEENHPVLVWDTEPT